MGGTFISEGNGVFRRAVRAGALGSVIPEAAAGQPMRVTVVNFDVSFVNLIGLLVKIAFAAIPAAGIVWMIVYAALALLRGGW